MALDGLGEKLRSLFKPKDDPRFKGQGRRLGTAEAHISGARPLHLQSAAVSGGRAADLPPPSTNANAPLEATSSLKPPPQPLGPGGRPALALSRSHRTEDVVLDAAVMANTPTGKEAHLLAAHKPTGSAGARAANGSSPASHLGSPGSPPAHLAAPRHPASPPYPAAAVPAAATTGAGGDGDGSVGILGGGLTVEVPGASPGGGGGGRGLLGGPGAAAGGGGGRSAAVGLAGRGRDGQFRTAVSSVSSMVSTISTPTAAEKRMGGFRCPAPPTDGAMADYGVAPATPQAYELQRCLALVLSSRPLSNCQLSTSTTASSALLEAAAAAAAAAPTGATAAAEAGPSSRSVDEASAAAAAAAAGSLAAATTDGGNPDPLASTSTSSKSLQGPSTSTAAATAEAGAGSGASGGGGAGAVGGGGDTAMAGAGAGAGPRECCDALLRVLRNVLTRPEEPKFRQIRLSNPRVQETIVGVPGAVEFLEAAGFKMRFPPEDGVGGDTAGQAHLVLPDEVPPTALAEAFRILSAVMAAHGIGSPATAPAAGAPAPAPAPAPATATAGPAGQAAPQQQQQRAGQQSVAAASAAPAVERCTQVLLPAAPDVTVPDWFFERTGAEVREQWAAMVRRREEQERFMTRTMREVRRQQLEAAAAGAAAGGGGGGGSADVATVRVRFPEGVCLQGQFGANEPVSRVFEWVTAALRSPALTFELIKPDRRPLTTTASTTAAAAAGRSGPSARAATAAVGTVRAADMLPSVLLNLRPTGQEAAALSAANVPLLSDALLRTTKPQ